MGIEHQTPCREAIFVQIGQLGQLEQCSITHLTITIHIRKIDEVRTVTTQDYSRLLEIDDVHQISNGLGDAGLNGLTHSASVRRS